MLESIGKLQKFKKTLEQAKNFTIFIYAHHKTLSLMRSFTKKRDIVRPGVTRFASSFLTLQSMMEKKSQLKAMFCSELWDQCKWSNTTKGQKAYATVMSTSFWNGVTTCLKVFAPLVKVLRLVDGDKKPAMASWLSNYGGQTPNLQVVAKRILKLTTSSSGCEQNWSTFEGVNSGFFEEPRKLETGFFWVLRSNPDGFDRRTQKGSSI
ncbi:hypothetical protein ACOSP7_009713 [Xanthoceras sorbifolium]